MHVLLSNGFSTLAGYAPKATTDHRRYQLWINGLKCIESFFKSENVIRAWLRWALGRTGARSPTGFSAASS